MQTGPPIEFPLHIHSDLKTMNDIMQFYEESIARGGPPPHEEYLRHIKELNELCDSENPHPLYALLLASHYHGRSEKLEFLAMAEDYFQRVFLHTRSPSGASLLCRLYALHCDMCTANMFKIQELCIFVATAPVGSRRGNATQDERQQAIFWMGMAANKLHKDVGNHWVLSSNELILTFERTKAHEGQNIAAELMLWEYVKIWNTRVHPDDGVSVEECRDACKKAVLKSVDKMSASETPGMMPLLSRRPRPRG